MNQTEVKLKMQFRTVEIIESLLIIIIIIIIKIIIVFFFIKQ